MAGPTEGRVEKRKHMRVNANLKLNVRAVGMLEFSEAKMNNISEGGLMFTTGQELPVGKEIELEVMLPTTLRIIRLKGRVVWNRKTESLEETNYDAGISITEINDIDLQDIREAIAKLEQR